MALLRVTNCTHHLLSDRWLITVDCFYPDDLDKEDRTYLVVASSHDISTQEKLREFIEKDILLQRTASPNWTGETWKSTRV